MATKDYKDARKWIKARPGYLKKSAAVTRDAIRKATGKLMGITDVRSAMSSLKKSPTKAAVKAPKKAGKVAKKLGK